MQTTLKSFKLTLFSWIGVIGSWFCTTFGGWSTDVETLLVMMGIDYIFGIINASVFKNSPKSENGKLSSTAGLKGIMKKVMMLMLVVVGYRLDVTLQIDYIRTAVCITLISNELISILETYTMTGMPKIPVLSDMVEVLNKKGQAVNDNKQ